MAFLGGTKQQYKMQTCTVFFPEVVNETSTCVCALSTRLPGGLGHSGAEDGEPHQQSQPAASEGVCGKHDSQHSSHLAPSTVDSRCHAVTTVRLLRRKRCWLSRTRSEPSSAGRPGRRRKRLRRTFRRELELERRGRRRTGGATTQVSGGGGLRPKSLFGYYTALLWFLPL